MTQSTQNLIENYYHYFNEKDKSAFFNLLSDNIVHDINQGITEIGKEAFVKFMARMDIAYDEKISNLVVMPNKDGSRAAAEFIVEGTYLATDKGLPAAKHQRYRLRCGAFFEMQNDKIIRVTNYYNMQEWLKQIEG